MQDCSNSIANTLELLQSCTKPSIFSPVVGARPAVYPGGPGRSDGCHGSQYTGWFLLRGGWRAAEPSRVLGDQLRLVLQHFGLHQWALHLSHTGEWRGKSPGWRASPCPTALRPPSVGPTPITHRRMKRLESWVTSFALSYSTSASISGPYTYHTQENEEVRVLGNQPRVVLQHFGLHQWALHLSHTGEWRG